MKIPKSKFNVGDEVLVRCEEAGCPPFVNAVVSGVWWNRKTNEHEYAITENGKYVSDGYTESWLTAKASNTKVSDSRRQKAQI